MTGVFVRQNRAKCDFGGSGSWVILSPVESGIRRKIEAAGTPLKNWDIKINFGIKTGCNKAFIINTKKLNEILDNCKSNVERQRTEELIRPILRGQDIKRYGYDWAGLWLINTHNGLNGKLERIHIEDYPAVKKWLDEGGIAYNGKLYKGYAQIQQRLDHGDTAYNLRNCAYLEDFSKPKILWKRIGSNIRFCYGHDNTIGLDSTCFAIGENIEFVCCVLNSPMGHYLLKDSPQTGTGDLLISVQAIEPIKIPRVTNELNSEFSEYIKKLINHDSSDIEKQINNKIFNLYNLTSDERKYIEDNFT